MPHLNVTCAAVILAPLHDVDAATVAGVACVASHRYRYRTHYTAHIYRVLSSPWYALLNALYRILPCLSHTRAAAYRTAVTVRYRIYRILLPR